MSIKIGDNNKIENSTFIGDENNLKDVKIDYNIEKKTSILKKIISWIKSLFIKKL